MQLWVQVNKNKRKRKKYEKYVQGLAVEKQLGKEGHLWGNIVRNKSISVHLCAYNRNYII